MVIAAAGELAGIGLLLMLGALAVFFIMREVMMWYWKINERLAVQRESLRMLQHQTQLLQHLVGQEVGGQNSSAQAAHQNLQAVYSGQPAADEAKHPAAAALTDSVDAVTPSASGTPELRPSAPPVNQGLQRTCPFCAELTDAYDEVCQVCGRKK